MKRARDKWWGAWTTRPTGSPAQTNYDQFFACSPDMVSFSPVDATNIKGKKKRTKTLHRTKIILNIAPGTPRFFFPNLSFISFSLSFFFLIVFSHPFPCLLFFFSSFHVAIFRMKRFNFRPLSLLIFKSILVKKGPPKTHLLPLSCLLLFFARASLSLFLALSFSFCPHVLLSLSLSYKKEPCSLSEFVCLYLSPCCLPFLSSEPRSSLLSLLSVVRSRLPSCLISSFLFLYPFS